MTGHRNGSNWTLALERNDQLLWLDIHTLVCNPAHYRCPCTITDTHRSRNSLYVYYNAHIRTEHHAACLLYWTTVQNTITREQTWFMMHSRWGWPTAGHFHTWLAWLSAVAHIDGSKIFDIAGCFSLFFQGNIDILTHNFWHWITTLHCSYHITDCSVANKLK